MAAAATGDPQKVEYVQTKFQNILEALHMGKVDIVAAGITHTMERQVYQVSLGIRLLLVFGMCGLLLFLI